MRLVYRTGFLVSWALLWGCQESARQDDPGIEALKSALAALTIPAQYGDGEALFVLNCLQCHGDRASGTEAGPPLVHVIYEPSHHADAAFQLAVIRGVSAHHWRFGDMAPVLGVTPEMTQEITAYVRWLQRQMGID